MPQERSQQVLSACATKDGRGRTSSSSALAHSKVRPGGASTQGRADTGQMLLLLLLLYGIGPQRSEGGDRQGSKGGHSATSTTLSEGILQRARAERTPEANQQPCI